MSHIINELPQNLGDYTLTSFLGSQEGSEFYEATQKHVSRLVAIELKRVSPESEQLAMIVAHARARAASSIPQTMPVLEARQQEDIFYLAQERPKGISLEQTRMQQKSISILSLCRIIERISELYSYCEQYAIPCTALSSNMIYLADHDEIRFLTPAQSDTYACTSEQEKKSTLAQIIPPLIPKNVAGQTRLESLITWIRDGFEGQTLTWSTIGSTASLIIEQIHPELVTHDDALAYAKLLRKKRKFKLLHPIALALYSILLAGSITWGVNSLLETKKEGDTLLIQMPGQWVTVHKKPVSILEYNQHLKKLSSLSDKELNKLHQGVPKDQHDHTPGQWTEQIKYLNNKKTCTKPVHSVSYWDALVYARLSEQSLPDVTLLRELRNTGIILYDEEWGRNVQDYPIFDQSYFIINAGSINRELNPNTKSPKRSFRTLLLHPKKPLS